MAERTWPSLLAALLRREDLTADDTAWAMDEIFSGDTGPARIAGFVTALRAKGETPAEIAGLAASMLAHATPVRLPEPVRTSAVDVVGTGGDGARTVNISTMAALVVAGAGVTVVKHGGKAATSACGTADVLAELGLPLDLTAEAVARCVTEVGFGFCFAQQFHPGMRHAAPVRRELGIPTAFNVLGPLTNPAQPTAGAVGCADARLAPAMARVYADRGHTVLVMRGEDGLDEFSVSAPTRLWIAAGGEVTETVIDATELGLPRAPAGALAGGDAAFNADVLRRVLAGERGPVRDTVLINAAAALTARRGGEGGAIDDLRKPLRAGLEQAAESIDSGAAATVLDRWLAAAAR